MFVCASAPPPPGLEVDRRCLLPQRCEEASVQTRRNFKFLSERGEVNEKLIRGHCGPGEMKLMGSGPWRTSEMKLLTP